MRKSVHIKSYGCQMNVYDASRMADVLVPMGYDSADAMMEADLVILNTCHIREKAAEKVYSELGRLRDEKAARDPSRPMRIAVGGCVAQAEGKEILRRAPFVDLVFGPQTYHRLPLMLRQLEMHGRAVIDTEFPADDKFDALPEASRVEGASAFLTVQEGCDKFCTFCVVPYTRGAEFSRPVMQIVAEAEALVAGGVRELTLLGQNVNAYHGLNAEGREIGLGSLARRLAEINGLARIRYTTSHPRDVDDDLIAAHGDLPELMPYLHLPVQSGSDRILEAMNRGHDAESYLRTIDRLRAARPDLAFSCDFIVGFPGESDADFEATLDLIRTVEYAQAYSFKYSSRPGTPAAGMPRQVPEDVKDARLARLQALLMEQMTAFNEASLGTTCDVLFERPGRHAGQLVGRSPYNQAVHVDAPGHAVGDMATVFIETCKSHSLGGRLLEGDRPESGARDEKRLSA